ncbi:MAG: O-antigen ligase family protein [Actinobacteria bacterium]|nr:O-antigen ligase family protein [Actinomycetota bacterium]
MAALELVVYAVLLAAAAAAVWRRPVWALYVFVVGLALHNAAMAALYAAGVRGSTLTAIAAWKEILLVVALARVSRDAWEQRALPFRWMLVDWLALAYGALVVVYALIPQSALDGVAGKHAIALALKHDIVPVGAYFLGRSLHLGRADLRRLAWTLLGTAGFVAALGIVDVYEVPIGWWRTNGVVDYFHKQLGYDYHGTGENPKVAGLPENFIYNTGSEQHFLRRLVSTFLSPLAAGYLMVVALLLLPVQRAAVLLGALAFAGLLFTFSRSSLLALAGGLVVLALASRDWRPFALAVVVVGVTVGWAHEFPKIGPTGTWTKADLVYQASHAKTVSGPTSGSAVSENEPSLHEHWTSLKDGIHTVVHHPQGYGLGNVGQTASRTGTPIKAGESNYTEMGAELGILGALLWTAWGLALLVGLWRAGSVRMAAAFAAILALAIQTDVIGDPWVAYVVWALAGALLVRTRPEERLAAAPSRAIALP